MRRIDPRRPEASGIPKFKISATFDFAISAAELSPDVFFDFVRDVSRETVPFETISGRRSFNCLKSRHSRRSCHGKVNKNKPNN